MTREAFHAFMVDPKTPAKLDMLLAHCAEIDQQQADEERRRKIDRMRQEFGFAVASQDDPRR